MNDFCCAAESSPQSRANDLYHHLHSVVSLILYPLRSRTAKTSRIASLFCTRTSSCLQQPVLGECNRSSGPKTTYSACLLPESSRCESFIGLPYVLSESEELKIPEADLCWSLLCLPGCLGSCRASSLRTSPSDLSVREVKTGHAKLLV